MKQCKYCGAPMEDFAAFCPQCAAPADQNAQPADNTAYQTFQNDPNMQQPIQNDAYAQQPQNDVYSQQQPYSDPYSQASYAGQQPSGYNMQQMPPMPTSLPDKTTEVLSVGKYIGMFILGAIPVVNIICWIVWLANANTNKNIKNYVIAQIVMTLIVIVATVLIGVIFGFGTFAVFDSLSSGASSSGYASVGLSLLNLL